MKQAQKSDAVLDCYLRNGFNELLDIIFPHFFSFTIELLRCGKNYKNMPDNKPKTVFF